MVKGIAVMLIMLILSACTDNPVTSKPMVNKVPSKQSQHVNHNDPVFLNGVLVHDLA